MDTSYPSEHRETREPCIGHIQTGICRSPREWPPLNILACLALSIVCHADTTLSASHDTLLERLEILVQSADTIGDGAISTSEPLKAVLEEGPCILEALSQRMSAANDAQVLRWHVHLFRVLSQFWDYPYSRRHVFRGGLDYYEDDVQSLPLLSYDIDKPHPDFLEQRDKLMQWWGERHNFPSVAARLEILRN